MQTSAARKMHGIKWHQQNRACLQKSWTIFQYSSLRCGACTCYNGMSSHGWFRFMGFIPRGAACFFVSP